MPLKFLGDFGKLEKIGRDLGGGLGSLFVADMARDFSKEAERLVRLGFETGTDPNGRRWKRAQDNKKGRRLYRTGHLFGSIQASHTGKAAIVAIGADYAAPLNYGTATMKARRMIPGARLPTRWRQALTEVFWQRVRRLLRKI